MALIFLGLAAGPAWAISYTGGSGRGDTTALAANVDVAGIASAANQTFTVGDGATAISAVTVTLQAAVSGGGINSADDVRVTIPAGLEMVWDSSDTTASLGGTASGKVSATVSYEDSGRTLVIDVTSDFAMEDTLVISGLSFTSFTAAGYGSLQLEIDNAGTVVDTDDAVITIFYSGRADGFTGGSGQGYALALYGGTNIYTWTGASDAASWADQGNWDIGDGSAGDDGYPDDASDKAVIDSTAHAIDTSGALTAGELEITAGFSGTLTLGGDLVLDDSGVWAGGLTLGAGIADADGYALAIDGDTVISGGTLKTGAGAATFGNASEDAVTISSGALEIESGDPDADITLNASTWTNSGGTVSFLGGSSTTVFSALSPYNDLVLNASGATLTSNADIDVDGDLTITAGTLDLAAGGNNLTLAGDWDNSGSFTSAGSTVTFDGSASAAVNTGGVGAGQAFNNVVINKTAGADADDNVTFQTNAALISGTLTITDGELIQSSVDLAVGAVAVAAAGKWTNLSDGDVTLSGDVANAGTIIFDAATGSPDGIVLRSSAAGTRRNWQGAGTFSLTDVDVRDMSATGGTPAGVTVSSGTNSGNNVNWFFGGAVTIGGNVYTDKTASTALTGAPLKLVHYDGSVQTIYTATTNGAGAFSVSMTAAGDGDPVVIYLDDDGGGREGVLVYKSDADGAADLRVFRDTAALRTDSAAALTNSDLSNADDGDSDIKYAVSGGNAVFEDNFEVFIFSGSTYAPGGAVELEDVDLNGTFDAGGYDVVVSGNWDATGGTFISGANTVTFDGTTALVTGGSGDGNDFYNVIITGTVTPATGAVDIDGNLNISAGALVNSNNLDITLAGNWANTGTFTAGIGTVSFDGPGTTVVSGSSDFYNLTVDTAGKAVTFTAGTNQTVNGTLTLTGASGNLVTLRSSSPGSKWDLTFPNGAQNVTLVDVKDSDANTNTVTCLDCNDQNNNNANWVFTSSTAILYPANGKTVDTTPTVIGSGTPGATVQILDKDDNVAGSAVVDAGGKFSVEVTAVETGANSLTPRVLSSRGDTVSVTVEADPAPAVVPVVTSHVASARVSGSTPTITGQGRAGSAVIIKAHDTGGNLPLATVGSGTVDASGDYSVTLTTALPKGTVYLASVVDDVASGKVELKFTDPFGVVFDSSTDEPVEGAVVTIFRSDGTPAVVGTDLDPGDVNPVVTGPDGFYSFLTADNDYYITVEALGYTYPSAAGSFPAGRVIVSPGSKGETFTVAGVIIEMDHPADANGQGLVVIKEANKKDVVTGDIVTYTVTVENPSASDVPDILLEDRIPAGFKYVEGRTLLDGASAPDPSGGRPLVFDIGEVAAGETRVLRYQLIAGSGVSPGVYENTAWARYSGGRVVSNTAREEVRVVLDALFDLGTVIGKVYREDGPGPGAVLGGQGPDLGGIRIVTEEGLVITTDRDGKFSVPGLSPGRHLFRLDERSLPAGAKLSTRKAVLADVRPGMPHKVNFGIIFPDQGALAAPGEDHPGDPGRQSRESGRIRIDRDTALPRPRLHAGVWPAVLQVTDNGLAEPAEFYIFTNYAAFIQGWTLDIRDADTGKAVRRFEGARGAIGGPVVWDGKDEAGDLLNPERRYEYVLTARGGFLKKDLTAPALLEVRRRTPDEEREGPYAGSALSGDKSGWLAAERLKNSLERQTISLNGETIRVFGVQEGEIARVLRGNEVTAAAKGVPAPGTGLPGNGAVSEANTSSVEMILPAGSYTVEVVPAGASRAEQEAAVKTPGSGAGDGDPRPPERLPGGAIERQDIRIGEDYLFFVGLGDAKAGYTVNTGNIEPVQSDDKFQEGFWSGGRAAYYLKGKISGKYLITASLDTDRDRREIFRGVDPDAWYPVYGDGSSVDYTAGDTQGMLYALIEWDRSRAQWGNFQTGLTETELASFNRSLYGGRVELQSVADTPYHEPRQKLIVFQARAQQVAARNEFAGAGGSLFYLKHRDIVPGSEQIKVEIRDKITGLVLSSDTMRPGVDYELDNSAGRIQFRLPVAMTAESGSIIASEILDGNPVHVVVDYAYETRDKFDEGARGFRAVQALGDHATVGVTRVEESQPHRDYDLEGVDVTLRAGENSELTVEYAKSRSQSSDNYVSTDGGIFFTDLSDGDDASGQAYGVKGESRALGRLGLTGYFKRIENGFSTESGVSRQGKEMAGAGVVYDFARSSRLSLRHDAQALVDGGNSQTRLQTGARKSASTSAQVVHQATAKLRLTGEWRHQEVEDEISGVDAESNQPGDSAAVEARYRIDEKTEVSLKQQVTLSGEEDHRTTAGVRRQVTERLTVAVEQSAGSKGAATRLAASTEISDNLRLKADYALAQPADGAPQNTGAVGADLKVDETTRVNSTAGLTLAGGQTRSSFSFGGTRDLGDDLTWTTKKVVTSDEDQATLETTHELARDSGRNFKAGLTERTSGGAQEHARTNIFGLSGDLTSKWSAFAAYEEGETRNHDLERFDRHAVSTGAGFVNIDQDSGRTTISAVSKAELRLDEGAEDKLQYNIKQTVEGRPTEDLTLYVSAEASKTENTTTGATEEEHNRFVAGFAYRPARFDRLNLLGRYTFLEDRKPAGQIDYAGIEQEKAQVLSTEAVYDINRKWQLTEKLALRAGEEQVSGFDWTKSRTWLAAQGLSYRWDGGWKIYTEYRFLRQELARDFKQGARLELSRDIGEFVNVGAGYDLTDFTDDLTNLDYTAHGPFVRVTGAVYDLNEDERRDILARRETGKSLNGIRARARARLRELWEQAVWLDKDAVDFFRKEMYVLAQDRYEELSRLGKDIRAAEKYARAVEAEIDREVGRFLKAERRRRRREAGRHYRAAVGLYRGGRYVEAEAEFGRVEELVPDYKRTRKFLGRIDQAAKETVQTAFGQ
jgi:uncharacterized repeat protein (TIGR01451 family)